MLVDLRGQSEDRTVLEDWARWAAERPRASLAEWLSASLVDEYGGHPASVFKYYLTYERTAFAEGLAPFRPTENIILFRAQLGI